MSGGSYDYAFTKVADMAKDHRLWKSPCAYRRAFATHLLKVSAAMRAVEWEDSGDTSLEDTEKEIMEVISVQDILQEVILEARAIRKELDSVLKKAEGKG